MRQTYQRTFAKQSEYKGITFRSAMEMNFAMYLDGKTFRYKGSTYYHKPMRWEYESKAFELLPQETWMDRTERDERVKTIRRNKKHTLERTIYTPDFYLPDVNLYIEIKGYQFDDGLFRLRLRLFKNKYPNEKIRVIRHHEEFLQLDEIIKNTLLEELEGGYE